MDRLMTFQYYQLNDVLTYYQRLFNIRNSLRDQEGEREKLHPQRLPWRRLRILDSPHKIVNRGHFSWFWYCRNIFLSSLGIRKRGGTCCSSRPETKTVNQWTIINKIESPFVQSIPNESLRTCCDRRGFNEQTNSIMYFNWVL